MDPNETPAVIIAPEPGAAAEDTAQVEAASEAAVEIAQIEAAAEVAIAESNNEAAVEIAEAMADNMEIDDQWLQSQFGAVGDGLANLSRQLEAINETLSAVAAILLQSTPTLPQAEQPPEPPTPPPEPEPTPPASEEGPPEKTRVRRLM